MSVWYHYNVLAMGNSKASIAKFFNLDPDEDVRTDTFGFSFGQKNGAGLRLGKIIEQNPDLIFLVTQSIECDTVAWWIERFDAESSKLQHILIQDFGPAVNELNKKVLEEYTKKFPSLSEKHLARMKGYEEFRWRMFFNDFDVAAAMLKRANEYEEMVAVLHEDDFDAHEDEPDLDDFEE